MAGVSKADTDKKKPQTAAAPAVPGLAAAPGADAGMNGFSLSGPSGKILQMLIGFIEKLFGVGGGGLMGVDPSMFNPAEDKPDQRTASSTAPAADGPFAGKDLSAVPSDGRFSSARALYEARRDNASGGYCGRGVYNILTDQGYNVTRANGDNWDKTLPQDGWVKLEGVDPKHAPEGAVLVYNSDKQEGRAPRNDGGGEYGHVEVVCIDKNGQREYVSDAARKNYGGTVPQNFVGAYVPRERYELLLAEQQREQQDRTTEVASNTESTPAARITTDRNTSVAVALGGQAFQINGLSLTKSFAQAAQLPSLGTGMDTPGPQQPRFAPVAMGLGA